MILTRALTDSEAEKVSLARIRASNLMPYMVDIIMRVRIYAVSDEDSWLTSMATDELARVYVNFKYASEWTIEQFTTALVHECFHIMNRTHARGREYQDTRRSWGEVVFHPELGEIPVWNVASDIEINEPLLDMGMEFPFRPFSADAIDAKPGEIMEYYADLIRERATPLPLQNDGGYSVSSKGEGSDGDSGEDSDEGGCGGQLSSGDFTTPADGDEGLGEAMQRYIRESVAEKVQEHIKRNGRGSLPGSLGAWSEKVLLPPAIPWQRQLGSRLRGDIVSKTKLDYSWRRVNRRADNDVVMPGMVSYLPDVAMGIDVSGSHLGYLKRTVSEVEGVCKKTGIKKIRVFTVDAQLQSDTQVVSSGREVVLSGGGGTDMRLAFEHVEQMRPKPSIFILATDGMSPFPEEPPAGMKVIFLLPAEEELYSHSLPEWGARIHVPSQF